MDGWEEAGIVVAGLAALFGIIGLAVNADIGPRCIHCGHRAQYHRYFENFSFPCRAKLPRMDDDGIVRFDECSCHLSEDEVRYNASLAKPRPQTRTSSFSSHSQEGKATT